jgi:catechol 2,3-dioxygenase-like lactoylglutathione lyase family enzyme
MEWTLEVVVLPVSDIDRSIAFYRDQVGFHLDHDTHNEHMHERSSASRTRTGTRGRCRRSRRGSRRR